MNTIIISLKHMKKISGIIITRKYVGEVNYSQR